MKTITAFFIFSFSTLLIFAQNNSDKKPFVPGEIREIQSARLNEKRTSNIYLLPEDHATITHQTIFNAFGILYPAKPVS